MTGALLCYVTVTLLMTFDKQSNARRTPALLDTECLLFVLR